MTDKRCVIASLCGVGKFIAFDNAKIVAEAREAPAGAR
jgi:hypothetical protein